MITQALAALALLITLSPAAFADSGSWTCQAMGQQEIPGPGGSIVMTTSATGDSEQEATLAVLQRCFEENIDFCTVTNCFQN